MAAKKARKSAFVPRLLVRTAIAGVVPACALGCGGSSTSSTDAGSDAPRPLGVAVIGYSADSGGDSVAATGYGSDARPDSTFLGVAAVAFRGYDGSIDDGAPDGGDAGATDAKSDAYHGPPFVLAVTAYEVGGPTKT